MNKTTAFSRRYPPVATLLFILASALLALFALGWTPAEAANVTWQATYWNNKTLSGEPFLTRSEAEINYDWGDAPPITGIKRESFSVEWRRSVNFPVSGVYRFEATMDDGMRVWVDGVLIIDSWWDSQVHSMSADRHLNAGDHDIKVHYYEAGGEAVAKLDWRQISASSPTIANWRGEYFNNQYLSGSPVLIRDDAYIDYDWGGGSPQWGLVNADQFSVRWTRNLSLESGRYLFMVTADDGARLWVNNQLIVDQWHDQQPASYTAEIDLPGGSLPVKLEYFENQGGSIARLSWYRKGPASTPIYNWQGEYFNNQTLSGSPAVVRDDTYIDFNWGYGSPANALGSDNFSVRWTRSLSFAPGRYRFTVSGDDGFRLWVNNTLLINRWHDGAAQSLSGNIDLPGGSIPIKLEFYENGGLAEAHLSWAAVSAPPPSVGQGTAVVINAYRLNVRTGPGVANSIITNIPRNTQVALLGRNEAATWAKIQLANGTQGWASAFYLLSSTPIHTLPVLDGSTPTPVNNVTGTVWAAALNVRSGPSADHMIVSFLRRYQTVTLIQRNISGTWVKVILPGGGQGWVNASYLIANQPIFSLPIAS